MAVFDNQTTPPAAKSHDGATVIDVKHVSMAFNVANQQLDTLKEYAIAAVRRELMFKEYRALNDVSLSVQKGEVFGILGTNGSGKSTLLKIIAGVLEPTEGMVSTKGRIAPLIELGAGFDQDLTGRENVYLNGALLGYSKSFIDKHFDAIVEFAEIREFIDMPLKNYSSGMVSRIAFAIATVIIPDILIVDEVLSVGDFMFRKKCEERIRALIDNHGTTVLLVSHSIDQIKRLCSKAIWIEKGRTQASGQAQDVCKLYEAIGGHRGTSASKQLILDTLSLPLKDSSQKMHLISGDNVLEVASKAQALYGLQSQSTETVVIAPATPNATSMRLIAQNLACATGGICLFTDLDELPLATSLALNASKPTTAIVLGCTGRMISPQVISSIRAQLPRESTIIDLQRQTHNELATTVQRYIDEATLAVRQIAIISDYRSGLASALISPLVAQRPVHLYFLPLGEPVSDELCRNLIDVNVKEILLLGEHAKNNDGSQQHLASAGLVVQSFPEPKSYETSKGLSKWLASHLAAPGPTENAMLIVCTKDSAVDLYPLLPLCEGLIHVLLIDASSMDEMANTIRQLQKTKDSYSKIIVLGKGLNAADREILEKAAA